MTKTAIFGGTFNPVHSEHVTLAKMAIEKLGLDNLIIMPTFQPPHKSSAPVDAEHRLNMLNLAFSGIDKITVSDFEIKKQGKSYTYETVEYFKKTTQGELYFIVGGDMLKDFKTWRYPERILNACTLVAFGREDFDFDEKEEREYFKKTFNATFEFLPYYGKRYSSTEIRVYNSLGLDITNMTDEKVAQYIKKEGLYAGDKYTEIVKKTLPEKRLIHTANVTVCALEKAHQLKLDAEKVRISAVLHDVAKYIDHTTVDGFKLPDGVPQPVVHSFLGGYIAKEWLKITDEEIVDAITYHTSGKPNMSTLAKLIFVADMIEPNRDYLGVEKLREYFYKDDFEKCFIECLKEEVIHLLNKKQYVYEKTLQAYDYYVSGKKEN